jgi:prepilin-type N-terminal cleavage/methylation domain-containing protein
MSRPSGFTLVELAIVLMIIGLLIGGILKGQELVQNARIISLARQIESYRAGVLTFQDSYSALPGDMRTPSTRLANCSASPCNVAGDGNGIIGASTQVTAGLHFPLSPTSENGNFWNHMVAAQVVSATFDKMAGDASTIAAVQAPVGGVLSTAHISSAAVDNYPAIRGHYLLLKSPEGLSDNSFTGGMGGAYGVTPVEAFRIDRKMDDGKPFAGSVIGVTGNNACYNSLEYANVSTKLCNVIIDLGI